MDIDIEEWASGARPAIRDMIDSLGGDVEAFDAGPLSAVAVLDDLINRMPWRQFEENNWVWIHSELSAFIAEVLIHHYGGVWKAVPDASAPQGWSEATDGYLPVFFVVLMTSFFAMSGTGTPLSLRATAKVSMSSSMTFGRHEYSHDIPSRKYGHLQYGSWGYKVNWSKYATSSDRCGKVKLGSGTAKLPTKETGWRWWSTSS
ncbi:hypothetical protein [Streptomyces sp. NPDC058475]|uniref:hypothetical protein n=2 Tax=Streptomyces TaxID=1883 RepID=UPI003651C194